LKTPEDEAFEEIERIQRTRTRWVPVEKPQDEIMEMAQECKLIGMRPHLDGIYTEALIAFAKLVTEKEREACAQILANTDLSGLRDHPLQNWVAGMLFEFIKAIRARGQEC
jgi:hypothetical protein